MKPGPKGKPARLAANQVGSKVPQACDFTKRVTQPLQRPVKGRN